MTDDVVVVAGYDRLTVRVVDGLRKAGERVVLVHDAKVSGEDDEVFEGLSEVAREDDRFTFIRGDIGTRKTIEKLPDNPRSVVLTDDRDVENMHDALAVREAFPNAHIVIRMFNTGLTTGLARVIGNCTVLSATKYAAVPLVDLAVGKGGPNSGPVNRGSIGRALDTAKGSHALAVWRQLWHRSLFRLLLSFIVLLVGFQSVVIHAVSGHAWSTSILDSFLATLTLGYTDAGITTDTIIANGLFAVAGMLISLALDALVVAVLFGLIADALISERFARMFGGSARRMRGHVVIVGLGTVGYRVVRELVSRGYRCVAIESNPAGAYVESARRLGVSVVIADISQNESLEELGISRAAALIAATDDDSANLEVGLTALELAPGLRIVLRMWDTRLANRLESLNEFQACRSVTRLASPHFVEAARTGRGNVSTLEVQG